MPTDPKAVNQFASVIVPSLLAFAVGYATYVFVKLLCSMSLPRSRDGVDLLHLIPDLPLGLSAEKLTYFTGNPSLLRTVLTPCAP